MSSLSYARHRFPPAIIQHAVWLYFRFALSYRDVEDLLAERGIDASYETVRRWALKFGRVYAARIRQRRPRPSDRWHLDEVFIRIGGKIHYLWRAVDDEGEVLDIIVQPRRDRKAALKLMRRLLKRQGYLPDAIVTDRLRSYGAALRDLGLTDRHVTGGRSNNRAEVSHQPTRRRERQRRGFQITGLGATVPCHPCRRLQPLQRPAPPDLPPHPSRTPVSVIRRMARDHRRVKADPATLRVRRRQRDKALRASLDRSPDVTADVDPA